MIVQVRLHTTLQRVSAEGRTGQVSLDLPPGACVRDVLSALHLTADEEALLLVLNRRPVAPDLPLSDGDTLDLIPAISGG
jgi:molybdopterin converting factor small subunit